MVLVSPFLLTLCILLSFSLPSDTQNFRAFKRNHIVGRNEKIKCNNIVKTRHIMVKNACKPHNTFIHASATEVQNLCSRFIQRRDVISIRRLHLTDCVLIKDPRARPPNCLYHQTETSGRIMITCLNGNPVHFIGYRRLPIRHVP
ncbi:hypothetical protein XELAEV_18010305mg [Xenopus laevis]|uniref:Ribonuclease A-domain domain-containing protein n=1 Tax=Xenopus laevis TaxID=8355 RepID=A0A974DUE1_XENLA|nr:hypothetical protein XELAEV_18010305mg [Xenopus laevis]